MKNGETVVGLFEGMFERNMLTFNPGRDNTAQPVEPFADVRELQRQLKARGITPGPMPPARPSSWHGVGRVCSSRAS